MEHAEIVTRRNIKRTGAALSAAALAVACIGSTAQAEVSNLADGSWWNSATASSQTGVQPIKVFVIGTGGDGGSCTVTSDDPLTIAGGKGAEVSGVLTLSPGDQLLARLGGAGGVCGLTGSGTAPGGSGVYGGGDGSAAISVNSGTYAGMNSSGAGGGGSTVIYRNNQDPSGEVVVAGGGGGAGGTAPKPSAPPPNQPVILLPGGTGGDAGQDGNAGTDGGAWGGTAGTAGAPAPAPSPQSSGLSGEAAATCETSGQVMPPYYCGGAGGNGGGAGDGATAAVGGLVTGGFPAAAGGGGGAGGSSTGQLGGIQYSNGSTGSGAGGSGSAQVLWADIPTGSVDNVSPGAAYTGNAFTADVAPATATATTWALLSGAPEGLTIDPASGQIGGTAPSTGGTYTFGVQATVEADVDGYGPAEFVSIKTITMKIASPVKTPLRPRDLAVKGSPTSKNFKISWKTPANPKSNRPVDSYLLTIKQRGFTKFIVRKDLPAYQHKFTISRAKLLRHSVLHRGDVRSDYLHYRIRIKAINTAGDGATNSQTLTLKL